MTVTCENCGACCSQGSALPVSWYFSACLFDNTTDLPTEVLNELSELQVQFITNGWPADNTPCVWLDPETKRCRHYEYRPDICRDALQPGDETCLEWRQQLVTITRDEVHPT